MQHIMRKRSHNQQSADRLGGGGAAAPTAGLSAPPEPGDTAASSGQHTYTYLVDVSLSNVLLQLYLDKLQLNVAVYLIMYVLFILLDILSSILMRSSEKRPVQVQF